ncbi:MAG: hypothetical protein WCK32_00355 [Chlorobiaceae bacterium]
MQAFKIHKAIVEDYKNYLNSFTNIRDVRIKEKVQEAFEKGIFLPEPLLQFNPSFELGESLEELETEKLIHEELKKIFGSYNLYFHQVEAIKKGVNGKSFIVTSGICADLHLQMNNAVFEAYGWQDINLHHDFYEVKYIPENDSVRYTIHSDARREILKRFLELNPKIHE